MKRLSLAILLCAVALGSAWSQSSGGRKTVMVTLTLNVNAFNASIYVDGRPIKGNVVQVSSGPHVIRVEAPGYLVWEQKVDVARTMTFTVPLQPQFFDLTVLSSVEGAAVTVDGRPYRPPLKLPAGEYVVRVTAPGYDYFEQKVNLYQAQTVSAMLRAVLFDLYIQCDVPSAVFSIGETVLSGASDKVPGGKYRIRASAPGYEDVIQEVNVTGNTIVPIKMRRAGSMAVLAPSEAFINKNAKGNHLGLMELWVDNVQMRMNRDRFEIPAGVHRVRFISGGLWTEIEIDFKPGVTYVLEPELVLKATPFLPGKSGPGDDKGRPVGKGDR